jgi:hypothetical protein
MADIDTALGEQIRDTLAKEFGEVNTKDFSVEWTADGVAGKEI